jgi:hypothetical protein
MSTFSLSRIEKKIENILSDILVLPIVTCCLRATLPSRGYAIHNISPGAQPKHEKALKGHTTLIHIIPFKFRSPAKTKQPDILVSR